jgi:hypothetical protein
MSTRRKLAVTNRAGRSSTGIERERERERERDIIVTQRGFIIVEEGETMSY